MGNQSVCSSASPSKRAGLGVCSHMRSGMVRTVTPAGGRELRQPGQGLGDLREVWGAGRVVGMPAVGVLEGEQVRRRAPRPGSGT